VVQRKAAAEMVAALDAEITMCLAGSRSVPEPDHLITAQQAAKELGLALRICSRWRSSGESTSAVS
jgi:hypothetical protein